MLVVVEGPDGAGKSTLIEQLRQNSRRYFIVVRASGPPPYGRGYHPFLSALHQMYRSLDRDSISIICDRFHPVSEAVYAAIIRGEPVNPNWARDLEDVDLMVYCRPPIEVVLDNVLKEEREQMAGVAEKIYALIHAYDEVMQTVGRHCCVVPYDFTQEKASAIAKRIWPT